MNQDAISDTNYSPVVQILGWFFLAFGSLGWIARIVTKIAITRRLDLDDYVLAGSLAFFVGEVIALTLESDHGLGKPLDSLDASQLQSTLQAEYAGILLFILSVGASKLSVTAFIRNLTPSRFHQRINYGLQASIGLWMITGILPALFRCSLPNAWDYVNGTCLNYVSWWAYLGVFNILTDLALVAMQMAITLSLNMQRSKKWLATVIFSSRLVVVAATIAQISLVANERDSDPMLDRWPSAVCNPLIAALGIVTASLPYLRPFLESLESGLMRVDDIRRREENGTGVGGSYGLRDWTKISHNSEVTAKPYGFENRISVSPVSPVTPGTPVR